MLHPINTRARCFCAMLDDCRREVIRWQRATDCTPTLRERMIHWNQGRAIGLTRGAAMFGLFGEFSDSNAWKISDRLIDHIRAWTRELKPIQRGVAG